MVYVIKGTVNIYCFCKNRYETAKEHLLFKLPPVSLKQIEKLHFSFKTVEHFSNSKPRPPGQRKLGENPALRAVRTCESPRVAPGGWSGLELTDTLVIKKWGASPSTISQIYKQCVLPILEYGSLSTITPSDTIISKIQRLQNKFI